MTTVEDIKLCSYGFALQQFIKANNLTLNRDGRTFNQSIISEVVVTPVSNVTTNSSTINGTNTSDSILATSQPQMIHSKPKRI